MRCNTLNKVPGLLFGAALAAAALAAAPAEALAGHAHTHIGRNEDQVWGTADDDVLWFFAMPGTPGWPDWGEPLELKRKGGFPWNGAYVCEELYCWHSGHPPHGNWQLGGKDEAVVPDWRIALERVHFDPGFSMCTYDTLDPVLGADGDRVVFDPAHGMGWSDTHYSEDGTLGAWRFGHHLYFKADAALPLGEVLTATFRAVDVRGVGTPFASSEDYTLTFVTTPEPATLALITAGAVVVWRRRRHRGRHAVP